MLLAVHWPFAFDSPAWLWLLLLIPALALVSARTLSGLEPPRRIVAIVLRSLVIAVLAVVLAQVQYVWRNDGVAVMFVIDRSRSIPEAKRLEAQQFAKIAAEQAKMNDRVGSVSFDGEADVDLIPSAGGAKLLNFSMGVQPDRTDISAGLRMAMASFPNGFARRVVLMTDGDENVGNLEQEIEAARAAGVVVDVMPLKYVHSNEILFDRITVPAQASQDTKVPVRLVLKSTLPTTAKLQILHNRDEVPLSDSQIKLTGGMQPDPVNIAIDVHTGGVHRFDAKITPLDPATDSIVQNNTATAFTFVDAQGRVLILSQAGAADDQVLYQALKREKVDVELRTVDQISIDLLKLQEYGVVILANISADTFNEEQHKALASYVKDFGGGLIMTGGDEGFGAGGWIGKPLEEVSPVSFEVKHKKIMPRGALVIIMHSCEIERGNYWGEQVAIASVQTISSLDYIGVICYAWSKGGASWEVPLQVATNKPNVIAAIKRMQIGDMPDFETTMKMAVDGLLGLKDVSQRHLIIISDGDPQMPTNTTIQRMLKGNITCSTVGIGYGVHVMEQNLRDIASKTGGVFRDAKNPNALPQIVVKEAKVIKRPLISEEEFQPQLVSFSQVVQGLSGGMPKLGGLVMTQKKPDATMPIARRTTDGDDPVLAYWNFEMGKMVAFTSGWWSHWGADWAGWEGFGKFWKQVIEFATRQAGSADFDVVTRLEGNKGHVLIEALNKDASYLNFLRIGGKVTTPNMESRNLFLTQTGPGQYEATFDVNDNGSYLVNLRYTDPQHPNDAGMIRTGLSVPYSPEYRELSTNMTLLKLAAERTGGRILSDDPLKAGVFDRNLPPTLSRQPIWRWIVEWVLLPLFILDVAGRRLASVLAMSMYIEAALIASGCAAMYAAHTSWIGYLAVIILAELIGWAIRWRWIMPTLQFLTAPVTALAHAGRRSSQSLDQLKDVREKVRTELESKRVSEARPAVPLEPRTDPRRRFDVGDLAAEQEAGDLTEAVGGAEAVEPGREGLGVRPAQAGDLADRLRRAKQRAQEQIKDKTKDEL